MHIEEEQHSYGENWQVSLRVAIKIENFSVMPHQSIYQYIHLRQALKFSIFLATRFWDYYGDRFFIDSKVKIR